MTNPYQELKDRYNDAGNLFKAKRILDWDNQIMMPVKAAPERGQVNGTISKLMHKILSDPRMGELLAQAHPFAETEWDQRNLQLMREDYQAKSKSTGLSDLTETLAKATSQGAVFWRQAKANNDWEGARPVLENIFEMVKRAGQARADVLGCSLYDAQLYNYSRHNSQAIIDPLFQTLRTELPHLIQQIIEKQHNDGKAQKPPIQYPLSKEKQLEIARALVTQIGYDPERGRVDMGVSAFNSGTVNDGRIAVRHNPNNPIGFLSSVLHEAGHAIYNWNMPEGWDNQPIALIMNELILHESQALIMQRMAGQDAGFVKYMHGLISRHEPGFADAVTPQDMVDHSHRVSASFIRVDADEATYPLHVVLRYEIEKRLFDGDLTIAEIPEYWNAAFKDMFGLDVPDNRSGCLQDVHWFKGYFGYFPTYTQGTLYAAQLFHKMKQDVTNLPQELADGNLSSFNHWLHDNVHRWGQFHTAAGLITEATGEAPNARYFLDHLRQRYL